MKSLLSHSLIIVVGHSDLLDDDIAILWESGQVIELWGVGRASSINEKGQIAGRSRNKAILWTPE